MSFFRSIKWKRVAWIAFASFLLIVLRGVYYTYCVLPDVYYSTALVEVGSSDAAVSLMPEVKMIQSRDFLMPLIVDLRLDKVWAKRVYHSEWTLPEKESLSFMRHILHIHTKSGTNFIAITVASEVPQETVDIANAVADRYVHLLKLYSDPRGAEVLERATMPREPTLPNHVLDLFFVLVRAFVFALPIAFLLELVCWYVTAKAVRMPDTQVRPKPSEEY